MLCSHKYKFIYLKTLKTAGTSVEILFERFCCPASQYVESHATQEAITTDGIIGYRGGDPADSKFYNHMPAKAARQLLGDDVWNSYFKFCVIRNPFDKVVSMFWFALSDSERSDLATASFDAVRRSFAGFVSNPAQLPLDKHIFMIDDAVAVDDFILFEKLQNDIGRVAKHLNLDISTTTLGNYKRGLRKRSEHFSEYYDTVSAKAIQDRYLWEIDRFGYKLGRFG